MTKESTVYLIETANGTRLIKAQSLSVARHHAIQGFIIDARKASVSDLVTINREAGGIFVEDLDELPDPITTLTDIPGAQ
jgi:hypothetical protein